MSENKQTNKQYHKEMYAMYISTAKIVQKRDLKAILNFNSTQEHATKTEDIQTPTIFPNISKLQK